MRLNPFNDTLHSCHDSSFMYILTILSEKYYRKEWKVEVSFWQLSNIFAMTKKNEENLWNIKKQERAKKS